MPSTRQPTPGPSTIVPQPLNEKKRANSEENEETRDAKKLKYIGQAETKDRKKRRKRRRKLSIAAATSGHEDRARPKAICIVNELKGPQVQQNANTSSVLPEGIDTAAEMEIGGDTSSSDKGKGKASAPDPPSEPTTQAPPFVDEQPEPQIARLRGELESQSLLLSKHQATLSQVQQTVSCQICLDLLYKPYALAPCGHVACYDCLVRWFTTTPGGAVVNDIIINTFGHLMKKKTCPVCRAVVTDRPIEVWTIKDLVANLLKSGLLVGVVPQVPEAQTNAPANPDLWHKIFRPDMAEMGMRDTEDGGIYRCIDCMHEIWDGVCSGCHRVYPGHDALDEDDDELERRLEVQQQILDILNRDEDDEDEEQDIMHFWREVRDGINGRGRRYPEGDILPMFADFTDDEDDEDEVERGIGHIEEVGSDDEDDGYESSFIDDEGGHPEDIHRDEPPSQVTVDSDSEGSTRDAAQRTGRAFRLHGRPWDSDEEIHGGGGPPPPRRTRAHVINSDSEEEESSEEEFIAPARNRLIVESEEEGDSENQGSSDDNF
ncbi:hypothetical protein BD779DRAFT_1507623 [Infundibulicybe gibba]|nr:hypothetical protein BD779DRAFT_1507623 [Infundibulicybe gibba]